MPPAPAWHLSMASDTAKRTPESRVSESFVLRSSRATQARPQRRHRVMSSALVPPELLDPVVAYFRPRCVILFGSAARGDARPDSDLDLLVVVDDDTPPEKVTIRAGREARRPYRQPADVIPVREETWRRFSRVVGTLPYAARTEGIVVYERG
jgi:hypothetical protein